ncbi:MAG: zinc ribbon domain-containing protein [Clostridia bacterium]|nr:zinc ribbon domain-containing protein [Clostridia bacterium]
MDKLIDTIKKGLSVAITEAGKITKTVAGKTNNLVDVTKLNLALNETEKKVSALFEKIGETVYSKYVAGELNCNEFDEILKEIDDFKAEQESIKAQIAELKNAITCPECGVNNDKGSEFCSKCGAKLTAEPEVQEEDKVIEVTEFTEE